MEEIADNEAKLNQKKFQLKNLTIFPILLILLMKMIN